jgi:hypothetical protein
LQKRPSGEGLLPAETWGVPQSEKRNLSDVAIEALRYNENVNVIVNV